MVWRVSNTAVIWARVPIKVHAELLRLAERCDRPIASEVRRALRFYLANFDEVDRVLWEQWDDPRVRIATVHGREEITTSEEVSVP
jgi:hypothetical protein